jgi:hypothetical protein
MIESSTTLKADNSQGEQVDMNRLIQEFELSQDEISYMRACEESD